MTRSPASQWKRDLSRTKPCVHCGQDIAVATVFDLASSRDRVLVLNPAPDPEGWVVFDEEILTPLVDDTLTRSGLRYRRHRCAGYRKAS